MLFDKNHRRDRDRRVWDMSIGKNACGFWGHRYTGKLVGEFISLPLTLILCPHILEGLGNNTHITQLFLFTTL